MDIKMTPFNFVSMSLLITHVGTLSLVYGKRMSSENSVFPLKS